MPKTQRLAVVLALLVSVYIGNQAAQAQLPNATDITATPAAGDHDYIHAPAETVNPANGSVSIRIPLSVAPARGITVPFTIAYDSNGSFSMVASGSGPIYRGAAISNETQGGWSYTFPTLSFAATTWTIPGSNDHTITCHGSYNYVYQDPSGGRHNMALSVSPNVASPDGYDNCNEGVQGDGEFTTGGEGSILATTSIPTGNTGTFPAVTVVDGDGTTYSFQGGSPANYLAQSIVDRNNNTASLSQSGGTFATNQITYKDSLGRNALQVSGIGGNPDSITSTAAESPYKVYWTTVSAAFTDDELNLEPGVTPNCPTSMSASATVVSEVVLPDGQSFKFSYDPTYGMLTKITYPTGGYVRYVWSLNSQAEAGTFPFLVNGSMQNWVCRYDFPAVSDRYVSYDGVNEQLHQHFAYATQWSGSTESWTQKTTTITTTDNVRSAAYSTSYAYSPLPTNPVPNCGSCWMTAQVPVEATIQHYDYNGSLLETVTKSWKNVRLVQTVQTALNSGSSSTSSLKVFCYNSWEEPTEVDEYDFGSSTPGSPCATAPSGATSGAMLRKTVTNYATFTGHIVDKPSSVITYDGSGNRVAETDYPTYDSVGNLRTKTADCFALTGGSACPQGNSTTTFAYDSNGQLTSMTDPNGNPATTFSYTDSYSSCGGTAPPLSPSDAYLTQVTYPSLNGTNHIVSFCYDYSAGLLLASTDENQHATTYTYADPFRRLTGTSYPDGGSVGYQYSDAGPSPTVTTTKQINSGTALTSISTMNGLGAPIETQLSSDPEGTDIQNTLIDGSGLPYQV